MGGAPFRVYAFVSTYGATERLLYCDLFSQYYFETNPNLDSCLLTIVNEELHAWCDTSRTPQATGFDSCFPVSTFPIVVLVRTHERLHRAGLVLRTWYVIRCPQACLVGSARGRLWSVDVRMWRTNTRKGHQIPHISCTRHTENTTRG